jgi:hypothetical protein
MSGESEFTDILQSLTAKSLIKEKHLTNILQTLTAKSPIRLTWSHYAIILQESSKEARDWYEQEAAREMWGTRTLQRNVSSQYYHRLLKSQNKALVHDEMVKLTSPLFEIPSLEKTQIKFGFSPAYSYLCNCILENL